VSRAAGGLDAHVEAYERDSPYYEENRIVAVAYAERIGRYVREHRSKSVLSLGIGHADVARVILGQLTGGSLTRYLIVDGAPRLIAAFKETVDPMPSGLELLEGYFESFEYPRRFDVIEAGFILEHVDDPGLILRRLHRFLAPSGRLFIAVPNARSLHRLLGYHAGLLDDLYALSEADHALGHKRYFDAASLTELVVRSGYRVAEKGGLLLKPFTTAQMRMLELAPEVWQALLTVAAGLPEISNAICIEATAGETAAAS
jgi:SAM-dependent methyltransferase